MLPKGKRMTRLDDLLATVDDTLVAHDTAKAEALPLLAGNPWCVNALAQRGIAVPVVNR